MSPGMCSAAVDDKRCTRPSGHPSDHTGHQTRDEEGVLHTWYGDHFAMVDKTPKTETFTLPPEPLPANPSVPDSVRTRVELHRAQTQYDLTVLKNRIDCMPTVTMLSKELRRKREQLTAELDAWTYLAGITKRVD